MIAGSSRAVRAGPPMIAGSYTYRIPVGPSSRVASEGRYYGFPIGRGSEAIVPNPAVPIQPLPEGSPRPCAMPKDC